MAIHPKETTLKPVWTKVNQQTNITSLEAEETHMSVCGWPAGGSGTMSKTKIYAWRKQIEDNWDKFFIFLRLTAFLS